jgi:RNA polymerase sigma-32 factor
MAPFDAAAFSKYRAQVSGCSSLDADTELDLARRWREGDRRAGDRIIESCLPFVMTIALEYRRWGLPLEDIVQEGNVGLLKAASRFDPTRGCRLATYAAYWIRAEIREFVARGYRIVRLGSSKTERRALRVYRRTHEQDPKALAALSGMTAERAETLLPLLMARDVSLDRPLDDGGSASERLVSPSLDPETEACERAEKAQLHSAVRALLEQLPARERTIVETRWLTDNPLTLEQLGARFGVSKERVRQLEERIRTRMRAKLEQLRSGADDASV